MQPKIEVSLISHTPDAVDLLIYTKSTRLEQGHETRQKIKNMSDEEKIKELEYMANTIPSSWEFVDYVFEIKNVTRAFTHQFVRTRTGSYAQQTMRMLDKKDFTYRVPPRLEPEDQEINRAVYNHTMRQIQESYNCLIFAGIPAEDARGVLPTNIHTNIIAKFNLRTMADMAKSRTGVRTQDEYREVMDQMIDCVLEVHPWANAFMFPVDRKNFTLIEQHLKKMHEDGNISATDFYDLNKACDKMRKGES